MDKRTTAYHEAGHAVALYAKGIPILIVSIVEDEGSRGRVVQEKEPEYWRHWDGARENMRALLVSDLAGVQAVEKLTGQPARSNVPNMDVGMHGSDYRNAVTTALEELAGNDEAQRAEEWKQAEIEAEWLLRKNWTAVEAVAEQLLGYKTLDAAALKAVLEDADCERDDSAVRRAFMEEEHEQLVGRRFRLVMRIEKLNNTGAAENEIKAVYQELQDVEQRMKEIEAVLWPGESEDG